jgi:hypothetical protein
MRARRKRSAAAPPTRLHYTKAALLIFGLGLAIGFVIVVGGVSGWSRLASLIMALGLVLLPLGVFADMRGFAALLWVARRLSRRRQRSKRGRNGRAGAPSRKIPPRAASVRTPRRVRFQAKSRPDCFAEFIPDQVRGRLSGWSQAGPVGSQ